jgi:peroxiredoxin
MPPHAGDAAPGFEALHCDGETFRPRSLEESLGERGAVLIFGGFVFSAIAQNWWTRYEKYGWHEFDGVPVYGVYRDGPYAINEFLRERSVPFSFFADVDGAIADAYDLLVEREGMAGRPVGHRRVDPPGADPRTAGEHRVALTTGAVPTAVGSVGSP